MKFSKDITIAATVGFTIRHRPFGVRRQSAAATAHWFDFRLGTQKNTMELQINSGEIISACLKHYGEGELFFRTDGLAFEARRAAVRPANIRLASCASMTTSQKKNVNRNVRWQTKS